MTVRIRPIVLADAASYRHCFDTIARERRYFPIYAAASLAEVRASVRKRLRQKIPQLVAVDGGRVVGWSVIFRPDIPSLSHNGDLVVGVHPAYRGKGLGTKLAAGILKSSRGKFDAVHFCFAAACRPARKLSKRLGFALCGRETKFFKLADGYDDQLITQKRMRGS